jgi:signal transduction histidine kinase
MADERIIRYIEATERLRQGDYEVEVPVAPPDEVGQLGQALQALARELDARRAELQKLDLITARINAGLLLDDILDNVYDDFRALIPYNRIGFSLIDETGGTVTARWARSDQPEIHLKRGYSAPLAGSSLQRIIETGEPRIINDLLAYLQTKPESESTRLIVAEGMRSSLTCPLIVNGYPVGFMFFSSVRPGAYSDVHVDVFKRIARQLSIIVDKGYLVSELAARQATIEAKNQELLRLNELKNSFLGMAAHDLRNPLSSIQLIASVLRDKTFPISEDERTALLDDIVQQTHHMLALLDDLLDVSQIEAGKLELRCEALPMPEFVRRIVERHAQLATSKGTTVTLRHAESGTLYADPTRLRQVLDNLISNAVKYSPPGSTVWVDAHQQDGGWRLTVQDQGPGISPADRDKLFTDFARLSARPTGGEKSTGLGLAITRRVVEAHGGIIDVDSTPGQGATFWVWLPAQPPA